MREIVMADIYRLMYQVRSGSNETDVVKVLNRIKANVTLINDSLYGQG
jgi:hypothetical protein